jgi:hypothetical protein
MQTFCIQIDGKQMYITFNLEGALQILRDEKISIRLWIDALCIDQSNMEERSEQVKSMARIYSQASRVVIWLGETDICRQGLCDLGRAMLGDDGPHLAVLCPEVKLTFV